MLLNTVGLTYDRLTLWPRAAKLAERGWARPLAEVIPAVTCTAQASILTGCLPSTHGIVGNGWYWRDLGEVRFWLQSNRLLGAEPLYATAARRAAERGRDFRCAKLFWWFNQGADVAISVTPKPHYGADGDKRFDITGQPEELVQELKRKLGPFPFHTFWGPLSGLPSSQWIGRCAAEVLRTEPDLMLVYLPHLDYDTQRVGPEQCDWRKLLAELDSAVAPIFDQAERIGATVWIINECRHLQVDQPIFPNRLLRQQGLLRVRSGPFGEMLETFTSRAFAVCDHQIAHVYVRNPSDIAPVAELFAATDGIAKVLVGVERGQVGLDHPRSGEVVLLAGQNAWFAYPYWLDDRQAPDFARTVNIHAKPGYDPCELFFDPRLRWPKGRMLLRLLQKQLGFRTLFDVVPLDAGLVRGSHGLAAASREQRPVMIGTGPQPHSEFGHIDIREFVLRHLGLDSD